MYDNLEVFITTYNRAEMLKETLKTICEQTAGGFDILIMDNASTDHTRDVVEEMKKQYPKRNITFVGAEENVGGVNNLNKSRLMAKKEWAMIFHDDDLMHPDYVKAAMDLLKQNPDAVMASCTYVASYNPESNNWENFPKNMNTAAYVVDVKDFAALLFGGLTHNFASTIYKTSLLREQKIKDDLYGKMWDRPFMLDVATHGKTVILKDPYVKYRLHSGQDTTSANSGPFAREWFVLLNNYKDILGNSWFNKYGFVYQSFVHSQLRVGYHWMAGVKSEMEFKEFKKDAAKNAVISESEVFKICELFSNFTGAICKKILYL